MSPGVFEVDKGAIVEAKGVGLLEESMKSSMIDTLKVQEERVLNVTCGKHSVNQFNVAATFKILPPDEQVRKSILEVEVVCQLISEN